MRRAAPTPTALPAARTHAGSADQNQQQLFKLIREGRFAFDSPYWDPISKEAKSLISAALTVDVSRRPDIDGILAHPWLTSQAPTVDITPALTELKKFNARRKLRAGIRAALAANRLKDIVRGEFVMPPRAQDSGNESPRA